MLGSTPPICAVPPRPNEIGQPTRIGIDAPKPLHRRRSKSNDVNRKLALAIGYVALLALAPLRAWAVEWDSLSDAQRQVLQNYRGQWAQLSPEQQQRLALGAERWSSMAPDERRTMQQRFSTWQRLPPPRRAELLSRFEQFRKLSPEQQHELRARLQRFKSLPPERQRLLRERFRNLSPEQRRRALEQMQAPRPADGAKESPPTGPPGP